MRTIEKIIEELKDVHMDDDYTRQMLDEILEIHKEERPTGWIPVSKEPAEGTYLITGQYGKNRYVDIATYDYGEWSSYSDEYKVDRDKHKVIAYMPLPKPYTTDNGGKKQ